MKFFLMKFKIVEILTEIFDQNQPQLKYRLQLCSFQFFSRTF